MLFGSLVFPAVLHRNREPNTQLQRTRATKCLGVFGFRGVALISDVRGSFFVKKQN